MIYVYYYCSHPDVNVFGNGDYMYTLGSKQTLLSDDWQRENRWNKKNKNKKKIKTKYIQ